PLAGLTTSMPRPPAPLIQAPSMKSDTSEYMLSCPFAARTLAAACPRPNGPGNTKFNHDKRRYVHGGIMSPRVLTLLLPPLLPLATLEVNACVSGRSGAYIPS